MQLKLENTCNIKVYISRGLRYIDSVSDSFQIKLKFNDKPNEEDGTRNKHEIEKNSYDKLYKKILRLYNTDISNVDIHYTSYYADNLSNLIYPRYIIIIDENLYTDFLMKRRNENIEQILK